GARPSGGEILDWLELAGYRLPPRVGWALRRIFSSGTPGQRTVRSLAVELDLSERTLRHAFHSAHLPPPHWWLAAARAVQVAAWAQASPARTLTELALEHGYASLSDLDGAFRSLFGLAPSSARRIAGWEWLLAEGLRRHAAPPAAGR
ncbi:MAG TPA: helix-turn-helix domain-containing protein, partial [Gemmatimonadales bacterium]|nr:helix-turn-helix domain-containing protein [Gemmatimonadales bacterium]